MHLYVSYHMYDTLINCDGNVTPITLRRTVIIRESYFSATKALLREPSCVPFPHNVDSDLLANDFGDFFTRKFKNMQRSLDNRNVKPLVVEVDECSYADASLSDFKNLTEDEMYDLTKNLMPTAMILQLLDDVPLPVITTKINLSFQVRLL